MVTKFHSSLQAKFMLNRAWIWEETHMQCLVLSCSSISHVFSRGGLVAFFIMSCTLPAKVIANCFMSSLFRYDYYFEKRYFKFVVASIGNFLTPKTRVSYYVGKCNTLTSMQDTRKTHQGQSHWWYFWPVALTCFLCVHPSLRSRALWGAQGTCQAAGSCQRQPSESSP